MEKGRYMGERKEKYIYIYMQIQKWVRQKRRPEGKGRPGWLPVGEFGT
jgi:hypothetical protein